MFLPHLLCRRCTREIHHPKAVLTSLVMQTINVQGKSNIPRLFLPRLLCRQLMYKGNPTSQGSSYLACYADDVQGESNGQGVCLFLMTQVMFLGNITSSGGAVIAVDDIRYQMDSSCTFLPERAKAPEQARVFLHLLRFSFLEPGACSECSTETNTNNTTTGLWLSTASAMTSAAAGWSNDEHSSIF